MYFLGAINATHSMYVEYMILDIHLNHILQLMHKITFKWSMSNVEVSAFPLQLVLPVADNFVKTMRYHNLFKTANQFVASTLVIPFLCRIYAILSFVIMPGSTIFSARFYGLEKIARPCNYVIILNLTTCQESNWDIMEKCDLGSATHYMFIFIIGWCLKSCICHEIIESEWF